MESLDTTAWLVDDFLNFASDIEEPKQKEDDEEEDKNRNNKKVLSSLPLGSKPSKEEALPTIFDPDKENPSFPEFQEEELEWLSNENAFPSIETFLPVKRNNVMKHQSPVSIRLESSSSISCSSSSSSGQIFYCGTLQVPVRARSKRRRRRSSMLDFCDGQWSSWSEAAKKKGGGGGGGKKLVAGRKCSHCLSEKTPQWRAGPLGPKTLCNACGVRYKSGRLMPEYRPACSPTFTTELHSNSHKKVLEMRRQKQKVVSPSMDTGLVLLNSGFEELDRLAFSSPAAGLSEEDRSLANFHEDSKVLASTSLPLDSKPAEELDRLASSSPVDVSSDEDKSLANIHEDSKVLSSTSVPLDSKPAEELDRLASSSPAKGFSDEDKSLDIFHEDSKVLSSTSMPLDLKPLKEEALPNMFNPEKEYPSVPEFQKDQLEGLSNENAFPSIETFLPMKPNNVMKHRSPVSIRLESSSSISCSSSSCRQIFCPPLQDPVRVRSKRRKRRSSLLEFSDSQWSSLSEAVKKKGVSKRRRRGSSLLELSDSQRSSLSEAAKKKGGHEMVTRRKCSHCLSEKTPQWRPSPLGTLCNACALRYKSGRLMPEYRPAGSPIFPTEQHSNSHKKILEMRKKQKVLSPSMDTG